MRAQARRRVVDKVAAAVMLQNWLDAGGPDAVGQRERHASSDATAARCGPRVAARSVGRSRRHRCAGHRAPAALACADQVARVDVHAVLVVVAALLVAGCVGLVVHPSRSTRRAIPAPVNFTVNADDTVETSQRASAGRGLITNARVFRWYVDHHGGLELTPGYYELRPRDHMGNLMRVLRTPPAETYTTVTFPEGFTLPADGDRLAREGAAAACSRLHDCGHRRLDPLGVPARGRHQPRRACCSPTRTRCRNGESPGQVVQRMVDADGARRPPGEIVEARADAAGADGVPGADHRLDDRARGEGRRGPPDDRPGHPQPSRAGHAAADRRDAATTGRPPGSSFDRAQRRRHAVQHLPVRRPAAHADRQPRPSLDRGRAEPGAEPVAG